MDELLTPISRSYRKETPLLQEVQSEDIKPSTARAAFKATSVDEAIESLRSEPDYDTLISVLRFLVKAGPAGESFDIAAPGPQSAKVVQILVAEIGPNYWALLKEGETSTEQHSKKSRLTDIDLFLGCLSSLTGLNACLARLRVLIQEKKAEARDAKRADIDLNLGIIIEILSALLDGGDRVRTLWTSTAGQAVDLTRRKPLSQEFLSILGNGRIISLAAEAQHLAAHGTTETKLWIADGLQYSTWLTKNLIEWSLTQPPVEDAKLCSDLLGKTLRLGYHQNVVQVLLDALLEPSAGAPERIRGLISGLPHLEQRKVIYAVLKISTDLYLNHLDTTEPSSGQDVISAIAGLIDSFVGADTGQRNNLITWLISSTGAGMGENIGIRRAVIAVLAQNRDDIVHVFEKGLSQFGDQLYIKHSPMLQQEAHAQVLLLAAGYVQRLSPIKLSIQIRSSTFMSGISNRLAASQNRARILGMIVGETLSKIVHNAETKLDFKMEETSSDEATWYKSLINISDSIGSVEILRAKLTPQSTKNVTPKQKLKQNEKKSVPTVSKAKAIIEEVDSESEDEGLKAYAKPDSDEEDSDDDPTLVRRAKPKAPVYIRDLIIYLRDTENYDRQKLALTNAPILIRRKANYGTEVKEHAEELASLLVGLQDKFELEDFHRLRIQGMVALIVAQPQGMGQWFTKTFFNGDYSISQRASILTVIGLGVRELAGYETSEYTSMTDFASKKLPEKIEGLYLDEKLSQSQLQASSGLKALPPNALDAISKSLTSTFLAPLAAGAADAATGPDALKLSTFTSRLKDKSQANTKAKSKPRVRAIPNTTAQLISTSFFFPLTARFQNALHSTAGRLHGIVFQPLLLSLFLKTLALLLHAAGPSTLALPDMTSELWGLLLGSSIRTHAVGDLGVTHAVLFTLLTLLDINENRMRDICQLQRKEVVETQEWVAQVFEGIRGEDGGEENEVKMLAAGILIRLRDGMEKYRMLLMGEMI